MSQAKAKIFNQMMTSEVPEVALLGFGLSFSISGALILLFTGLLIQALLVWDFSYSLFSAFIVIVAGGWFWNTWRIWQLNLKIKQQQSKHETKIS